MSEYLLDRMDTTESVTPKDAASDVEGGSSRQLTSSPTMRQAGGPVPPAVLCMVTHTVGVFLMAGIAFFALKRHSATRGFFCNDTDIALPFKPETVSFMSVVAISVIGPLVIMALLEGLVLSVRRAQKEKTVRVGKWDAPERVVEVYQNLGGFAFAIASCWILTEVLKEVVGALRPHFLSVCQPRWDDLRCKSGEEYKYVSDYQCTGDVSLIYEARRSFPSGHSSVAMCGMLYLALYLQGRFKWQKNKTAPAPSDVRPRSKCKAFLSYIYWTIEAATPCLQVLLILTALFVVATRVLDHFHHVRDVVAGSLLGAVTALHAAFFVTDMRGK